MGVVKGKKLGTNERYRGRTKEGACLLVKEELERNVKEWREVSSRLMRMRMTLGCERCVSVQRMDHMRTNISGRMGKRGIISGIV